MESPPIPPPIYHNRRIADDLQIEPGEKDRQARLYWIWRRAVLYQAHYRCQRCGTQTEELTAHHVRPWATYPALRFKRTNGMALCRPCHSYVEAMIAEGAPMEPWYWDLVDWLEAQDATIARDRLRDVLGAGVEHWRE